MDFTNDINCGGRVIMLEVILWFIGIIIIVPVIYLAENFILSAMPGQKRSYLFQPIYRLIKLFSKTDCHSRSLACVSGSCLRTYNLYFVSAGIFC